jgi:hypothetical protein
MKTQLLLLSLYVTTSAFAFSPAPPARPKLEMLKAIELAQGFAAGKVDLKDYYLERVWISNVDDEGPRKWIVSWCPDGESKKLGWFIVVVDMEGRVDLPKNGVHWIDKQTAEGIKALDDSKRLMKDIQSELDGPEKK